MKITIKDEYIKLGQALKLADIAQSGTEAKMMIEEGSIKVNGETENRRGRKLYNKDIVECNGKIFSIKSELTDS